MTVMRGSCESKRSAWKRLSYYVQCAAHQLILMLSMAASCNKKAKLFFVKFDQIPFFSKSSERRRAVEENAPSGCKIRWN